MAAIHNLPLGGKCSSPAVGGSPAGRTELGPCLDSPSAQGAVWHPGTDQATCLGQGEHKGLAPSPPWYNSKGPFQSKNSVRLLLQLHQSLSSPLLSSACLILTEVLLESLSNKPPAQESGSEPVFLGS